MKDIGSPVKRLDHDEKVSGRARYVDDIQIQGMLVAKTFRSTIARGTIQSIRYPDLPQGYWIVDARDVPGKNIVKMISDDMPVFAEREVRYYGEPIGLVVGKDRAVVDRLAGAVHITYQVKEGVFDDRNIAIRYHFTKGEPEKAFQDADRVIRYSYETGYQEQAYLEPQGMVGIYEDGKVTLMGSMQCPFFIKSACVQALGCEEDRVRVIQPAVGGAFGGKEEFPSLIACQLAVALVKIQQPIKLIYERQEDLEVTTKRHPARIKLEAAIQDQDMIAMRCHVSLNGGAYFGLSKVVLARAVISSGGVYTIDNLDVSGDVYVTNTVPNGAFRGFGAPQVLFAVEMFVHHVARDLGIDPFSFRIRHLARQGDLTSTSGTYHDPIIMPQMIEKAVELSNYHEKVRQYAAEDRMGGIGMSWFFHGCGFTGNGESQNIRARVKLTKDESDQVEILIAAVDMGQGAKTTMTKIVAKALDLPMEQVTFNPPDTDMVPDSGPTVASRTTMIVGGLLARAAGRLKEAWVGGQRQEVMEEYRQPDHMKWDEAFLRGDAYPGYSWGVNVVEVQVDPLTCEVSILGAWSVYDVGKAVDDRIVQGQADGGLVQGLGYGYLEAMEVREGRILQRNLTDYILPTACDTGPMETCLMENPYPLGPFGAKGVGELTLLGAAPAVALAIEQAIGRRVTQIPVTPERIMEWITHGNDPV